jgi:hypothetical protein
VQTNGVQGGTRTIPTSELSAELSLSASFGWARGTMEARSLPSILGMFLAGATGWSPTFGDPFRKALNDVPTEGRLDIGCVLGSACFEVPHDADADAVVVGEANTALVSLTLALLKRLQGLGSSPAIDYDAYAAWVQAHPTGEQSPATTTNSAPRIARTAAGGSRGSDVCASETSARSSPSRDPARSPAASSDT